MSILCLFITIICFVYNILFLESVPFGSPKSILTHNNAVVLLLLWDVWALDHAPFSVSPLDHAPKPTPQPISVAQPSHSTILDVLLCKLVRLKYPPGNAALGRESPGPRDGQTAAGKRQCLSHFYPSKRQDHPCQINLRGTRETHFLR